MLKFKMLFHYAALWMSTLFHLLLFPLSPTRVKRRRLAYAWKYFQNSLPIIDVDKVIGESIAEDDAVCLKAVAKRDHNCTIFELTVLGLITAMVKPRRCIEIGTYDGRSTLTLAANLRGEGEVHTVNLPEDYMEKNPDAQENFDVQLSTKVKSGERWVGHPEASRITQVFANSADFDFAPYCPSQLIFIDGGHDEVTVESDSRNAFEIVDRENGAILWHDATILGIAPVLAKLTREGYPIYLIRGTDVAILRYVSGKPIEYEF